MIVVVRRRWGASVSGSSPVTIACGEKPDE